MTKSGISVEAVKVNLWDRPEPARPPAHWRAWAEVTLVGGIVISEMGVVAGRSGLHLRTPQRCFYDVCPHCGQHNGIEARYCESCGGRRAENRAAQHLNLAGLPRRRVPLVSLGLSAHSAIWGAVLTAYMDEVRRVMREAVDVGAPEGGRSERFARLATWEDEAWAALRVGAPGQPERRPSFAGSLARLDDAAAYAEMVMIPSVSIMDEEVA